MVNMVIPVRWKYLRNRFSIPGIDVGPLLASRCNVQDIDLEIDMERLIRRIRPSYAAIIISLATTIPVAHADVDLTVAPPVEREGDLLSPRAYFSEQGTSIDMVLSRAQSCPIIIATLVQMATRLEAEVTQRQLFDCDDQPSRFDGGAQTHAFQFTVPKVKREARFEWRFAECDAAGANCSGLINVPFDAFPTDPLEPVRNWATRESLVVKDSVGSLAEFLDLQRIEFIERRSGITKGSQLVSLLVEDKKKLAAADLAPYLERGGVIVFRKSQDTLPLIRSRRVAGQALISVELPLIESLPANPRAQKALLEIFQMLFETGDNI